MDAAGRQMCNSSTDSRIIYISSQQLAHTCKARPDGTGLPYLDAITPSWYADMDLCEWPAVCDTTY
jgi:hypothetical protein|eukprot:COSAG01_NODE_5248_length_4386_cov_4.759972_5_plen_66_part_00